VQAWSGVRHADRFAPECIQTLRAHNINHYFGEEATSEDCLYLNVWAPSDEERLRPVVVWIYGGGFTVGSAAMANYHGETLARKGLVYVSIAYRLGALGFLAHPALTAESSHRSSGNHGFLDQIAALKWIQRNIARFGGDPNNVTIMGQSAGSMSVSVLQASPLAKGLFHRAVGMSGGVFASANPGAPPSLSVAEVAGRQFQERLKAGSLGAMRDLPADRILAAQLEAPVRYGPIVDGHVLPATPAEIFASGRQHDVPIMIGFTRDESFSELARATTLEAWKQSAGSLFGHEASTLLALYPAKDDAEARRSATNAARDSTVSLQMRKWAQAQVATGKAPVFAYFFSRVHPYVPGVTFADHDPATVGAYHTGDVPYWLGTLDSLNVFRRTRDWSESDRHMSDLMSDAIVEFARNGNPNPVGKQDWPAYRASREQVREFGDGMRVIAWPNVKQIEFFSANLPKASSATAPARARD
jgi:para-nitrobenzyl esterase